MVQELQWPTTCTVELSLSANRSTVYDEYHRDGLEYDMP